MQVEVEGSGTSGRLVELASGVDAVYLSGRASLPTELLERLGRSRELAESGECSVPFDLGGCGFMLRPYGLGRYRFRLDHPNGVVGITPSRNLPAIRVQPRAELIHGEGPVATVLFFADLLENAVGPLLLSVSRLDLHADFQGWELSGDDRHRFVCRGRERDTYEEGEDFTGFVFGKRATGTISARVYDKTIEVNKKGSDYWPEIWGASFDPARPVLRVEFEIGRAALREYGVEGPDEVLAVPGAIWANLTDEWLTYRLPIADSTKSRWPIASEWRVVQRASIRQNEIGLERTTEGKRVGDLRRQMPRLVGELTSFGAVVGTDTLPDTVIRLAREVRRYEVRSGVTFQARVRKKRAEAGRA